MVVLEITSSAVFRELCNDPNKILVVDFYADWCGPCNAIKPLFINLAQNYKDIQSNVVGGIEVVFGKVNVDYNNEIVSEYNIRAMPTFLVIHKGTVEKTIQGTNIDQLEHFLNIFVPFATAAKKKAEGTNFKNDVIVAQKHNSVSHSPDGPFVNHVTGYLLKACSIIVLNDNPSRNLPEVFDALYKYINNKATSSYQPVPLGLSFIPFLWTYPKGCDVLQRFFNYIIGSSPVKLSSSNDAINNNFNRTWLRTVNCTFNSFSSAHDAFAIVFNIMRYITNALTNEGWNINITDPNAIDNLQMAIDILNLNKKPSYNGNFHTLALNFLQVDFVSKALALPGFLLLDMINLRKDVDKVLNNSSNGFSTSKIFRCPSKMLITYLCRSLVMPSKIFNSLSFTTGKQMELYTLLGSLLSPGLHPSRQNSQQNFLHLLAIFGKSEDAEGEYSRPIQELIKNSLSSNVDRTFNIFRYLLRTKGPVRRATLLWMSKFFHVNSGFVKTFRDQAQLCSDTAMLTFAYVMVELALPVVNTKNFEASIPISYVYDYNRDIGLKATKLVTEILIKYVKNEDGEEENIINKHFSDAAAESSTILEDHLRKSDEPTSALLVNALTQRSLVFFGPSFKDVERVSHFTDKPIGDKTQEHIMESENLSFLPEIEEIDYEKNLSKAFGAETTKTISDLVNLISEHGPNTHAPKVHLFFMAIRAISLTQSSMLLELKQLQMQISHPSVNELNRNVFFAKIQASKALLTCEHLAKKTLKFLDGVARWLLYLLKVNPRTGELPDEVPMAWKVLPQQIVDDVFRSLKLLEFMKNSTFIQKDDFYNIISLLLVLMGDLKFFPKVHTHVLFPQLLLDIINSEYREILTRHEWWESRIILGLINTYNAMEKSYYDRSACRYYLSILLKDLLKNPSVCNAARTKLEDVSNALLEHFAHFLNGDVNSAVDEMLEVISLMKRKEEASADEDENQLSSNNTTINNRQNTGVQMQLPRLRRRNNRRREEQFNNNLHESEEEEAEDQTTEQSYNQLGERLRGLIHIFNANIDVFRQLIEQYPHGILHNMVAQQTSHMIVRTLALLAGPNSKEYKIRNPSMYGFQPRDILGKIIDCLMPLRREKSFIVNICNSAAAVTKMETLIWSIDNMTNPSRPLLSTTHIGALEELRRELIATSSEILDDDKAWEDIPDWGLCELMKDLLTNPVVLPTTVTDKENYVFVNYEAIHHSLLSEQLNPFNRMPLTEEELMDFNKRPEIVEAVKERKKRIADYLKEQRAQKNK